MLYEVGIENFKPFGTRQVAPLRRITLIYGPNSGGKSSLIQGLLLLKQSIEGTSARSSGLVPRGDYVDLGSFRSFIHRHDRARELRLSFSFDQVATRMPRGLRTLPAGQNRSVTLAFRSAASPGSRKKDASELASVTYMLGDGARLKTTLTRVASSRAAEVLPAGTVPRAVFSPEGVDDLLSLRRYVLGESAEEISTDAVGNTLFAPSGFLPARLVHQPNDMASTGSVDWLRGFLGGAGAQGARLEAFGAQVPQDWKSPTPTADWWRLAERLQAAPAKEGPALWLSLAEAYRSALQAPLEKLALEFEALARRLTYLGPLRSHPARHYLVTGGDRETVGVRGEETPLVLFRRPKETQAEVNRWLQAFEIPYKLHVKLLGDELIGEMIALSLRNPRAKLDVGPSDVGFGIGQLLPIIVEGVVSEDNLICVEQPEIHLHPKLQAHIADFLIDTAGGDRNTQWIVETHSEALILRVQRRIREGKLGADDVSVLYVNPGTSESTIQRLRLAEDGRFLDEWPAGFFEERFDELFPNEPSHPTDEDIPF